MKAMKIKPEDKALIKAYIKWCAKKGFWPTESECSSLIDNRNCSYRDLVETLLNELRSQYNV